MGDWNYNNFKGWVPHNMGVSGDRFYWEPSLVWMRENTPESTSFLTWWDYGHWITSVSKRHVLIDNLQADSYQIQDVARFFVNKTTEEEAYETVKAYQDVYAQRGVDLRYVVIDFTMIGKGSALHFIATGDLESCGEGSFRNYAQCQFIPQASDRSPRIVPKADGTLSYQRNLVFGCQGYIPGVRFTLTDDQITGIDVILDNIGSTVPWETWVKDNDASLLGVQSLNDILALAIQSPDSGIISTFRTLVYVPGEFQDYMMTRLYLGDHLEEYKALGLYNREIEPLKHFKLLDEFEGNLGGSQGDKSTFGYVRVYEIIDEPLEDSATAGAGE